MTDRKDIIAGLETVAECVYFGRTVPIASYVRLLEAVEALKEQEPVKPIFDELDVSGCCGNCGHSLTYQKMFGENVLFEEQYAYCPFCGKAVKWDAAD